ALLTVDPHLHRVHQLVEAVPVEPALSLSAADLLGAYIAGQCENPLLLGPDEESAQWLDQAAQAAGAEAGLAHKQRRGDRVRAGEPLYRVYAEVRADFEFARQLCERDSGYTLGEHPPPTHSEPFN
ncbi:MAG TPA: hypothetical protein VK971_02685, partial [Thiohalobacter sp.]|nr:hypothetical protein [Thiohalobacter sp.]